MPECIYVERAALAEPLTEAIVGSMAGCPVEVIDDHRRIRVEGRDVDDVFRRSKRRLALAVRRGAFVKPFAQGECDAGRDFLIAHGNNCPFDCDYCFLQAYFEHAVPTIYVNVGDLCSELAEHLEQHAELRPRYHAGELCDALVFDRQVGLARKVLPLLEAHPGATLELRTKADVGPPSDTPAAQNVIAAWTLTPNPFARVLERGAPSPVARMRAARAWQDAGFRVGVRLDPVVRMPGWEAAYAGLIAQLADKLDPAALESIVLGGLRFVPDLAKVARSRGRGKIFVDEFVLCTDGKMRYFRPIRQAMYRDLIHMIRPRFRGVRVEVCMETSSVRCNVASQA